MIKNKYTTALDYYKKEFFYDYSCDAAGYNYAKSCEKAQSPLPCDQCQGRKKVKISISYYDSEYRPCDNCKGEGVVDELYIETLFTKYKNRIKQDNKIESSKKRILKKLTVKEVEFINRYGLKI